jgi:hypothetical protein
MQTLLVRFHCGTGGSDVLDSGDVSGGATSNHFESDWHDVKLLLEPKQQVNITAAPTN